MAKTETGANFDLSGGLGTSAEVTAASDTAGMVFDLSNAEAPKMDVVPKGTYKAIVESFEFGESQKGNAMISLVYSIIEGEFTDRKIFDYLVLTGKGAEFSLPKVKQLLQACCPETPLTNFNPVTFAESGEIINRPCMIKLKIQKQKSGEYAGSLQNRVTDILSASNVGDFM